jgi:hypothetical protein
VPGTSVGARDILATARQMARRRGRLIGVCLPRKTWTASRMLPRVHEKSRSFPFATLRVRMTPASFLIHFGGLRAPSAPTQGPRPGRLVDYCLPPPRAKISSLGTPDGAWPCWRRAMSRGVLRALSGRTSTRGRFPGVEGRSGPLPRAMTLRAAVAARAVGPQNA